MNSKLNDPENNLNSESNPSAAENPAENPAKEMQERAERAASEPTSGNAPGNTESVESPENSFEAQNAHLEKNAGENPESQNQGDGIPNSGIPGNGIPGNGIRNEIRDEGTPNGGIPNSPFPSGSNGGFDRPTPSYPPSAPPQSSGKNSKKGLVIALSVVSALLVLVLMLFAGTALHALLEEWNDRIESGKDPLEGIFDTSPSKDSSPSASPSPTPVASYDQNQWVNTENAGNENAIVRVAATCSPSIVTVNVTTATAKGSGSGVIWTGDGYIVTNNHVVEDAVSLYVTLENGDKYPATCIARDPETDLALLRIHVKGLLPVIQGNGSEVLVGETAIVIGNPLGTLANSVTSGIVSALARDITLDGTVMHLMQVTAAINPGNSGGGCFNAEGQLIGIVNSKKSATSVEGIGFAIPIETVKTTIGKMIEEDDSTLRKSLGITQCYEITKENYSNYSNATLISKMEELSGAPVYGLIVASDGMVDYAESDNTFAYGDLIKTIDGKEIRTLNEVNELLEGKEKGEELTVVVSRLVSQSYGFMQNKYSLQAVTLKIRVIEMYR